MFGSRLRIPRVALATATRQIPQRRMHSLPQLPHNYANGIPGLLSAEGYDMAWTQYQTLMLDKLNSLIAGTEFEQKDTHSILTATAREPSKAPIFNHASMAHNNHFFFRNLTPNPRPMPDELRRELDRSFGSIETLRTELITTANAMFGPGFVWLVQTGPIELSILTTYLAGSPYPQAHWRRQDTDMNTTGARGTASPWLKSTQVRGLPNKSDQRPPGGVKANPILCLNTWEHVWLRDYGIGAGGVGGKKAFAEAWWEAIDWEAVSYNLRVARPSEGGAPTKGSLDAPQPEQTSSFRGEQVATPDPSEIPNNMP